MCYGVSSARLRHEPTFCAAGNVHAACSSNRSDGRGVALLGVPFDGGTSYRSGARLGPREIRAQSSLIRPYSYFQKVAPFDLLNVADVGDIDAPPVSIEKCYDVVEARIGSI